MKCGELERLITRIVRITAQKCLGTKEVSNCSGTAWWNFAICRAVRSILFMALVCVWASVTSWHWSCSRGTHYDKGAVSKSHMAAPSLPCLPRLNLRVLEVRGNKLETFWENGSQAPLHLRELSIAAPLSNTPKSIGKTEAPRTDCDLSYLLWNRLFSFLQNCLKNFVSCDR